MSLAEIWSALPKGVRIIVAIGIVAMFCVLGTVVGYLAWYNSDLPTRLGVVATTKDIEHQTEELRDMGSGAVDAAVSAALAEYDHNLRGYLAGERLYAVDTILNPLLGAIQQLDKRQRQMQAAQQDATAKLDELPKAYDEKLERLMRAAQPANAKTEELLHQVLQRLEEQDEQLRELQSGRRVKKQVF